MYARLSVFEGSPDQIDEGIRQAREQVMPRAKQMDGFKRMIALGDRQSGKTVGLPSGRAKKPCVLVRRRLTSCAKSRRRLAGMR